MKKLYQIVEYAVTFRRIVRIGSEPSVVLPVGGFGLEPSPPCAKQARLSKPPKLKTGFFARSNPPLDSSDTSCLESSRSSIPFGNVIDTPLFCTADKTGTFWILHEQYGSVNLPSFNYLVTFRLKMLYFKGGRGSDHTKISWWI